MKFWKGNRADAGFEMPVAQVAKQYVEWSETIEAKDWETSPLERTLRWWLTDANHFNSVWEDENRAIFGTESFDGLYDAVWDLLYKVRDEVPSPTQPGVTHTRSGLA